MNSKQDKIVEVRSRLQLFLLFPLLFGAFLLEAAAGNFWLCLVCGIGVVGYSAPFFHPGYRILIKGSKKHRQWLEEEEQLRISTDGIFNYEECGFSVHIDGRKHTVNWGYVQSIYGYAIQQVACLDIVTTTGEILTFSEGTDGWEVFYQRLQAAYPAMKKEWLGQMDTGGYEVSLTLLYERGAGREVEVFYREGYKEKTINYDNYPPYGTESFARLALLLSYTALEYLSLAERRPEWVVPDGKAVRNYLEKQHIAASETILGIQATYSGLVLSIHGHPEETFNCGLFSADMIANGTVPEPLLQNGTTWFELEGHATGQFFFMVNEQGAIGTCDGGAGEVNVIYSSVEYLVESYALASWLCSSGKFESPWYFDVPDAGKLNEHLADWGRHDEACDNYNQWLSRDGIFVHIGTWFHGPHLYLHFWAGSEQQGSQFETTLRDKDLIGDNNRRANALEC